MSERIGVQFRLPSAAVVSLDSLTERSTKIGGGHYWRLLRDVGARRPSCDAVDQRIVDGVHDDSGMIITTQDDVGGWPNYPGGVVPPDDDRDGMTNEWEEKFGINPTDSSDNIMDTDSDGYTNVEEFLNGTHPHCPD